MPKGFREKLLDGPRGGALRVRTQRRECLGYSGDGRRPKARPSKLDAAAGEEARIVVVLHLAHLGDEVRLVEHRLEAGAPREHELAAEVAAPQGDEVED